jgi:4-nitrophenyl phosphatase
LTIVFDLDGVVYRGETALPGAVATLHRLAADGHSLFFLTNNATRSRRNYSDKLERMGIPCRPEQVMTAAYATALYLSARCSVLGARQDRMPRSVPEANETEHRAPSTEYRTTAFVVGESGLIGELEAVGVSVIPLEVEERADYVVVGLDKGFNYAKLVRAYREIVGGAQFIATNRDPTFPLEEGVEIPGGGTMVAAIAYAVGREPIVIGKPEPFALERILELAGARPSEAVMVGDRTDTDIKVGRRVGLTTVLTLTGVTPRLKAEAAPPDEQPDYIVETLEELPAILERRM